MPRAPWNIVGQSSYVAIEPPAEQSALRLNGDRSVFIAPLAWPLSKQVEENLAVISPDSIQIFFTALLPDDVEEEPPYPENDEDLPVYTLESVDTSEPAQPDFPWELVDVPDEPGEKRPRRPGYSRPKTWGELFRWWYYDQRFYRQRQLVEAFGQAVEVATGLPLERAAPSLHSFVQTEGGGRGGSGLRPVPTSRTNRTAPRSSKRRTT